MLKLIVAKHVMLILFSVVNMKVLRILEHEIFMLLPDLKCIRWLFYNVDSLMIKITLLYYYWVLI